jgi:hypothetical protein
MRCASFRVCLCRHWEQDLQELELDGVYLDLVDKVTNPILDILFQD